MFVRYGLVSDMLSQHIESVRVGWASISRTMGVLVSGQKICGRCAAAG